ncbi:MAG: DUF5063 domain-containing protein [Prolixibacteraceae bacterium]|nr:DUF5063 domain-containing protein [Prolixibacteraceae bacterium]NLO03641.1 DUF5063 domain-containing protein [Bacteroidales bacterium]
MENDILHSLVYSKNTVEFVTVASEFCSLMENVRNFEFKENMHKMQRMLPLLYLKASMLPKTEKILENELEKYISEMDYNVVQQRWLDLLGENDSYYEVFDPDLQFSGEPVTASISESLTDIYQDLKDFIIAYSIGNEEIMNDALYDCEYHFEDFWGQRLVNVLRAVHMIMTGKSDPGTENEPDNHPLKVRSEWLDKFWDSHSKDDANDL